MERLLKYIKDHYKEGEPILLKDLKNNNISYDNLRQKLKKLTDSNKIIRLSDGIYSYGSEAKVDTILEKRFIKRNNKVFGYKKNSLPIELGITTDNEKEEIITNDFKAIVREIECCGTKIKIRHSKISIDNNNFYILQFLDLVKELSNYEIDNIAFNRNIKKYIKKYKIQKKDIDKYINFYPSITFKNLYKYNLSNILI